MGGQRFELATTLPCFASFLQGRIRLPILDKTGLQGVLQDGKPLDPPSGSYAESQVHWFNESLAPLGLRLTKTKQVLSVFVIDRLERRPTEN